MTDYSNEIRAYALRNASEHGNAQAGKILPKLFQHGLAKEDAKSVMAQIQEIVSEVNGLKPEEIVKQLAEFEQHAKERAVEVKGLPELANAKEGKVVLRVAPFPSGPLHIGNAKTFLLNALYAEKYKGKLKLIIDDTIGSEKKPIEPDAYTLIPQDLEQLGIKIDGDIIYKSDRLEIYYEYAEKLIKKGKAYVDYTAVDEMREMRKKGIESGHRELPVKKQLENWKEMFKMKEGTAVLRLKTDMMHKNPAFRDRVLFKISQRRHPKQGNSITVWPTLEMSWAIDDHLLGMTHIIRGNDLQIESDMERYIWDIFEWKHPEIIHTGLVSIEGVQLGKSKSSAEVKSGKYTGWDDPRTWSIQSLVRRGISKEALRTLVEDIGLNKQDTTIPIETLFSVNRKLVDPHAGRYSFVSKPVELNIRNKPEWQGIDIPIHPDKKEKRSIMLGDSIYISKEDYTTYKGQEVRLLHLYNLKIDEECEVTKVDDIGRGLQKLNWVSGNVNATVLLEDGKTLKGLADAGVNTLTEGEVIQFERFGFVRYLGKEEGKKGDTYNFIFAHK